MRFLFPSFGRLVVVAAAFSTMALVSTSPSRAQTALCPAAVGAQAGIALTNGTCTNGFTGAFSGAALSTQALSDLSQSATQETVRNTSAAVSTRREEEQQRCPDGFSRINGTCERNTPLAARPAPARVAAPKVRSRVAGTAARRRIAPAPVVAAPVEPYYPAPIFQSRYGAWTQVFGNSEDRSASGTTSINCCTAAPGAPAAGLPLPLVITEKSSSSTVGFLVGFDYTSRALLRADDGLIFGVLTGFTSSEIRVRTTATSTSAPLVGNGSGSLRADVSGPSAGFYLSYFAGPLTADLTFKADIYDFTERFSDNLAFTQNVVPGVGPAGPAVAGVGAVAGPAVFTLIDTGVNNFTSRASGGLTNLSTFGNLAYRLFTLGPVWVEPTVGFQYTASIYDSRAKRLLGLDQGDFLMFQGGARFGTDTILANGNKLTTTLTGLAYSDVIVDGGFVGGGAFATDYLAKADEGKVRGRGILSVNYQMAGGVSLFGQGDVYGGDRLFGAGGKGGVRVQW